MSTINELYHYGIKGMKWKHHKYRNGNGSQDQTISGERIGGDKFSKSYKQNVAYIQGDIRDAVRRTTNYQGKDYTWPFNKSGIKPGYNVKTQQDLRNRNMYHEWKKNRSIFEKIQDALEDRAEKRRNKKKKTKSDKLGKGYNKARSSAYKTKNVAEEVRFFDKDRPSRARAERKRRIQRGY